MVCDICRAPLPPGSRSDRLTCSRVCRDRKYAVRRQRLVSAARAMLAAAA